ncbi:unnamed protein product [Paramecium pentaurelia]|uniref:Transmembrane protein n=1 Tax=Paramecium pentaurelia TaxID=43138 RepID=A0A8S1SIL6_9CILI|nr:unnamed protein product [Paramecium pentaurelia]
MITFLCFLQILKIIFAIEIQEMDQYYQIYKQLIDINDINFDLEDYYFYGVWSKYIPLSPISQVGNIGLFDSNCFNIHNIIDQTSQSVNLIYYDCLDFNQKLITKTIIFSDNERNQHKFVIQIDPFEYENVWYFYYIFGQPQKNKLELIVTQLQKKLLHEIILIKFPFKIIVQQFTFGGDLTVKDSMISSIERGKQLCYFPGKIILEKFMTENLMAPQNLTQQAIENFNSYTICNCKLNNNYLISDTDIKWLDKNTYSSENMICNSFALQGWIKIIEIFQSSEEFTYYLIKLSANFDNSLSNQNLSPLQFGYKISPTQNFIVLTTYKYSFPQVTIDFQQNPFLIEEMIEIQNNINLWHYLYVKLLEDQLFINIIFYQESNVFEFKKSIEVRQFHYPQLKLQYGNYLQQHKNYLNVQIRNLAFLNCDQYLQSLTCHFSCYDCDGPTKRDCLSCSQESNRIYYPEFKMCLCPLNTTDESKCQSYEDSKLNLISNSITIKCQYGYFEFEDECLKCPSIIYQNFVSCVECLQNTLTWSEQPYCSYEIYLNEDGTTQDEFLLLQQYFLFDGSEIYVCQICEQTNLYSIEEQYLDFYLQSLVFKQFCKSYDYLKCYECSITFCLICQVTLEGLRCAQCIFNYKLVDGYCISQYTFPKTQFCISPNYLTSNKICKLCPISNCKYCFEYSMDDISKSTLYRNFEKFDQDEHVRIGCSLCNEGYTFNFNLEKCEFIKPQIQYCLRSFINFNNQEICTLSSLDFNIAPEIINCQKYKPNCLQCVLSPESIIKCVQCKIGYSSSVISGDCYEHLLEQALITIDGDWTIGDGWVQRIQSFMMQFLPNKYFYPQSQFNTQIAAMIIECNQGYQISDQSLTCQKYCSSECLQCEEFQYSFKCTKCPLNYYQFPIRDQINGQCSECPQLCNICKSRSLEDIYRLQPNYILTKDNLIYTKNCIQPINDINVILDPYYNIAKYCFNQDCTYKTQFDVLFSHCEISRGFWPFGYEYDINTNYCNQMGIDTITINFNFQIDDDYCGLLQWLSADTELKQKIFSLKKTIFKLSSPNKLTISTNFPISIKNFDCVEILNIGLIFGDSQYFQINNNRSLVEIKLINFSLSNSSINNINSLLETQTFGNLTLINVTILNTIFVNSSFINLKSQILKLGIEMISLNITNCTFIDTNLFQFTNNFILLIDNLHVKNCKFINSSIFRFLTNKLDFNKFILKNSKLQKNSFVQSNFINSTNQMEIKFFNLIFKENRLSKSIVIGFNSNFTINLMDVISNNFEDSTFLSTLLILTQERIFIQFSNLQFSLNIMKEAELVYIFANQQVNNLILSIFNLYLNGSITYPRFDRNHYLFNIYCFQFSLLNVMISNVSDPFLFYIADNYQIDIKQFNFINSQVQNKIPLQNTCKNQYELNNNLFLIEGFFLISLENILIKYQSSIDKSIIGIRSSQSYLRDLEGQIRIKDLEFNANILLQQNQSQFFSLLAIESQGVTKIIFENLRFLSNCLHSFANNQFQTFASLLYISCKTGFVEIINMNSISNSATNTSNSFIYMLSNTIIFSNITISNNNILPQSFWSEYYNIEFDEQYSQEQINQIVQQVLNVENIGGVAVIRAQNFICNFCFFNNILVFKSSIFEITTLGDGIIELNFIVINSTLNNRKLNTNGSGCISINSQNSKLNLKIQNAIFFDVINRMAPSILSVIPSNIQNNILLFNVSIENCISLYNQILKATFSSQIMQNNTITFHNIKLVQKEMAWKQYFQKLGILTQSEINQIIDDNNAVLNIAGSSVLIQNIIVEGLYFAPLFKIQDAQKFFILNCQIQDIQIIYPFDLIHYYEIYHIKSQISFQYLSILNISIYTENQIYVYSEQIDKYQIQECNHLLRQPQKDQTTFNFETITQILQEKIQLGKSLLYFSSSSNQSQFFLSSVQVNLNNCSYCSNGLIFFQQESFHTLQIQNFECNFNNILSNGCLKFILKNKSLNYVKIKNSNFLYNNGTQGIAVQGINTSISMKYCFIMHNKASLQGGGLYLEQYNEKIFISQSLLLYNIAKEGGGIYLYGDNNLYLQNLNNSYLQFNKAESYGNNLVESPTHLALNINDMEMMSKFSVNQSQIRFLKLDPYLILDQEIKTSTQYLMIPSNQQLKQYKIYLPKEQESIPYINSIYLTLKNSRDELQLNFNKLTCSISQTTVLNTSNKIVDAPSNITLEYDSNNHYFDLKELIFRFDPYNIMNNYLQIKFNCSSDIQHKQLIYLIKARSFKCQLGEIYQNNGCQLCQSQQGFYSVQYDQQKCSIFDKQKFADITSNNINLLEGYWRPHYLSDYSNLCFKNFQFCLGGWGVGNQLCSMGHIGALCEECDTYNIKGQGQYFKNLQNSECLACFGVEDSIIPFIITSLWACFSIILTLKSIATSNRLFVTLKLRENQDHQSILIKMLLNYLWIYSVIFTFNINFSFSFNVIDNASNTSYFMANNLDCYLSEYLKIQLVYSKVITIKILILYQFIIILLGSYVYSKIKKSKYHSNTISHISLCLYIFNYAGLIKMLSSIVSLRVVSNHKYIQGDVSLRYDTDSHYRWITYFFIPDLLFFGYLIPLCLFVLLYAQRNKLDSIRLRGHICYLFNEYNQNCYFWELIKLSKKAIMIFIMTYFETNISLKAILLGLCLVFYQLIAIKNRPYIISKFNSLDLYSGQLCSISIFLAAAKYHNEQSNDYVSSIALQVLLIIFSFRLCQPYLVDIIRIYYKKYKVLFFMKLNKILRLIKLDFIVSFLDNKLIQMQYQELQLQRNFNRLRSIAKSQVANRRQERSSRLRLMTSQFNSQWTYRFRQNSPDMEHKSLVPLVTD